MKQLLVLLTILFGISMQAQFLDAATKSELISSASSMGVDKQYGNGDWSSVLKEIDGKQIVLIGEFSHGAKEPFLVRNELIKALHAQQGFDVIFFEAGIGEMAVMNLEKTERTPTQLTDGFFGPWRTAEFDVLMGYVKEKNLKISGYDVQKSGASFQRLFLEEAQQKAADSVYYYSNLAARFNEQTALLTDRNAVFDSVQPSVSNLITDYKTLLSKYQVTSTEKKKKQPGILCARLKTESII